MNEDINIYDGSSIENSKEARSKVEIVTSVGDPWHFGSDPVPGIRTSDYQIQIRIQLRIRLLSSVTLRMEKYLPAGTHIIFSLENFVFC